MTLNDNIYSAKLDPLKLPAVSVNIKQLLPIGYSVMLYDLKSSARNGPSKTKGNFHFGPEVSEISAFIQTNKNTNSSAL